MYNLKGITRLLGCAQEDVTNPPLPKTRPKRRNVPPSPSRDYKSRSSENFRPCQMYQTPSRGPVHLEEYSEHIAQPPLFREPVSPGLFYYPPPPPPPMCMAVAPVTPGYMAYPGYPVEYSMPPPQQRYACGQNLIPTQPQVVTYPQHLYAGGGYPFWPPAYPHNGPIKPGRSGPPQPLQMPVNYQQYEYESEIPTYAQTPNRHNQDVSVPGHIAQRITRTVNERNQAVETEECSSEAAPRTVEPNHIKFPEFTTTVSDADHAGEDPVANTTAPPKTASSAERASSFNREIASKAFNQILSYAKRLTPTKAPPLSSSAQYERLPVDQFGPTAELSMASFTFVSAPQKKIDVALGSCSPPEPTSRPALHVGADEALGSSRNEKSSSHGIDPVADSLMGNSRFEEQAVTLATPSVTVNAGELSIPSTRRMTNQEILENEESPVSLKQEQSPALRCDDETSSHPPCEETPLISSKGMACSEETCRPMGTKEDCTTEGPFYKGSPAQPLINVDTQSVDECCPNLKSPGPSDLIMEEHDFSHPLEGQVLEGELTKTRRSDLLEGPDWSGRQKGSARDESAPEKWTGHVEGQTQTEGQKPLGGQVAPEVQAPPERSCVPIGPSLTPMKEPALSSEQVGLGGQYGVGKASVKSGSAPFEGHTPCKGQDSLGEHTPLKECAEREDPTPSKIQTPLKAQTTAGIPDPIGGPGSLDKQSPLKGPSPFRGPVRSGGQASNVGPSLFGEQEPLLSYHSTPSKEGFKGGVTSIIDADSDDNQIVFDMKNDKAETTIVAKYTNCNGQKESLIVTTATTERPNLTYIVKPGAGRNTDLNPVTEKKASKAQGLLKTKKKDKHGKKEEQDSKSRVSSSVRGSNLKTTDSIRGSTSDVPDDWENASCSEHHSRKSSLSPIPPEELANKIDLSLADVPAADRAPRPSPRSTEGIPAVRKPCETKGVQRGNGNVKIRVKQVGQPHKPISTHIVNRTQNTSTSREIISEAKSLDPKVKQVRHFTDEEWEKLMPTPMNSCSMVPISFFDKVPEGFVMVPLGNSSRSAIYVDTATAVEFGLPVCNILTDTVPNTCATPPICRNIPDGPEQELESALHKEFATLKLKDNFYLILRQPTGREKKPITLFSDEIPKLRTIDINCAPEQSTIEIHEVRRSTTTTRRPHPNLLPHSIAVLETVMPEWGEGIKKVRLINRNEQLHHFGKVLTPMVCSEENEQREQPLRELRWLLLRRASQIAR